MDETPGDVEVERLCGLLRDFNRAWQCRDLDRARRLLHPDVVFVGADFATRLRGADACIESLAGFLQEARLHSFEASDYAVDIWPHIAVVRFRWRADYELAGERYLESGREWWNLLRAEDGQWRALFRQQISQQVTPVAQ